jgi:MerR family transcriptional regulator/heat shock protein HspR
MEQRETIQEELKSLFEALLFSGRTDTGLPVPVSSNEDSEEPEEECSEQLEAEGLYIISVAARILGMHPQTLRKYERLGFINPCRTGGMLRLYTERDIVRLRLIRHLQEGLGLNLAGVEVALNLLGHLVSLRRRLEIEEGAKQLQHLVEQELGSLLYSLGFPTNDDNT